jgi:hypothetical protein
MSHTKGISGRFANHHSEHLDASHHAGGTGPNARMWVVRNHREGASLFLEQQATIILPAHLENLTAVGRSWTPLVTHGRERLPFYGDRRSIPVSLLGRMRRMREVSDVETRILSRSGEQTTRFESDRWRGIGVGADSRSAVFLPKPTTPIASLP